MSMSLCILCDKELSSIAEWQTAIDAEGYQLELDASVELATHGGFLPSHLRGAPTGFELDQSPANEVMQEIPDVHFDHNWKFAVMLTWLGSKESELLASWMAAVAYAEATDGIILDGEECKFHTAPQARKIVNDIESFVAKRERRELKRHS